MGYASMDVEISATYFGRLSMSATWTLLFPADGVGFGQYNDAIASEGKSAELEH
jgi:hypothetical protein